MQEAVVIEPYNEQWPVLYEELRQRLVTEIADSIVRIDHIGSTAVAGLAAKPIIDIQISVLDLKHTEQLEHGLSTLGFVYRRNNPDLSKKYFREAAGMRRTHIHVREAGSWSEQFHLLFRDYLRAHKEACSEYEEVKKELAKQYTYERERYVEGKSAVIWRIMQKANSWSQEIGWKPEPCCL